MPPNANGVLYALGGFSAGLALYVKEGVLSYEYNLFEIQRTHIKAKGKLPAGKAKIEVETSYVERKPAGPLKVVLKVNGTEVASGKVPVSAPIGFTANDALDFGIELGSPVGIEYYDQAPFKFNGKILGAQVKYLGDDAKLNGKAEREVQRPIPVPTEAALEGVPCYSSALTISKARVRRNVGHDEDRRCRDQGGVTQVTLR